MRIRQFAFWNLLFVASVAAVLTPAEAADPAPAPTQNVATATSDGKTPPEVEQAMQLPDGPERTKAITTATGEWAKKEPIAAMAWLLIPKNAQFWGGIAPECGRNHGKLVADWLVQQKNYSNCLHGVILSWTRVDPLAAAAWCEQAPKDARRVAFFSVSDAWVERDFTAVTTWAVGLAADEDRKAAIEGVVQKWGRGKNIPALAAWAKQLKPADALTVAKTVDRNWVYNGFKKDGAKDVAGIRSFLDQLPLSDAEKAEIQRGPAAKP